MTTLRAGDVLSYSAGTTQTGPDGFRYLTRAGEPQGADMLAAVAAHRPELLAMLGTEPPLLVNGYPARTGDFAFGIQVDSYLSIPVALRALRLARREGLCAIMLAQPLWFAELLVRADEHDDALPASMIAAVGGYPMPASLERFLLGIADEHGLQLAIAELFGIAEVDAGALIGGSRLDNGTVVFHPRDDIRISDLDGFLALSRRRPDGSWSEPVSSDDRYEIVDDGGDTPGLVILDGTRVAPEVRALLESWDDTDWRRRTGYLRRDGDAFRAQLRTSSDVLPGEPGGCRDEEHHDFTRETGASYLTKPIWR